MPPWWSPRSSRLALSFVRLAARPSPIPSSTAPISTSFPRGRPLLAGATTRQQWRWSQSWRWSGDRVGRAGQLLFGGRCSARLQWVTSSAMQCYPAGVHCTGVMFRHSQCIMADITDGASNTFLLGERYCWPDHYDDGLDGLGDDQGWTEGYDYDTNRWVQFGDITNPDPPSAAIWNRCRTNPAIRTGCVSAAPTPTASAWRSVMIGATTELHDRSRNVPSAPVTARTACRPILRRFNRAARSARARNRSIEAETCRLRGNREHGQPVAPKKIY